MEAINIAGNIIRKYEGCGLKAYPDPATGGEPWTIGWGSTFYEDGVKVKKGDVISQDRADSLLYIHINHFYEKMKPFIKAQLNDNQIAALISFAYNCGVGAFSKSTLLKKSNANPSDPSIRDEFNKWTKANGKVFAGLVKRRKAEADLYFKK